MSRHRLLVSRAAVLCCLLAFSLPARAATTMFLKVDGIKGDSTDKGHPGQIEVQSFNTGVTQSGSVGASGATGSVGRATVQPFIVTKPFDTSSPHFFLSACNGKHIQTVVLEVVIAGEKPQPLLRYTLGDVIVSAVNTSASSGGDAQPVEQISFSYGKITVEYMGQSETGKVGTKSDASWDMKANKGASSGGAAPDGSAAAAATAAPDPGAGAAPAAGAAAAGGGGASAGAAPAGAAPAGDAAAAKPMTRAQRERLKLQQAQPAPAPAK